MIEENPKLAFNNSTPYWS